MLGTAAPVTDPIVLALLAEMKSQRISATDIALRAGYDRKTLTDLKHGRHSTRVSTLRDLGAVLGLDGYSRRQKESGALIAEQRRFRNAGSSDAAGEPNAYII
ncbi:MULTISPECIES: helix-turn-helix transcriptional regulator [unclassified Mesorhizobium]|uniref:helix-turn-helix transcriptional regulator n=1 Tax=unclassified Mesorhizobium TaxID=325217 RepID=UPI000FD74449|nr:MULTISPECIES: helix-turn-helix transcriptional regulator [unclassified Mesorhizobium]TGT76174.1 XRE family transcriptional regulator [Mesorhizobium sp. M2E.F.Ca.ET.166.01.1.1]TGW02289.1 XRE family transcriptional regulator [Mesorhizobium sp. M2E.F.Ca.ET.154.01.1.1]